MDLNELYLTNPDVIDLVIALSDEDFVPRDKKQRELAEAYARRLANHWFAVEDARDNGIASDAFYQIAAEDVRAIVKKRPGILSIFDRISSQYDMSDYEILEPLLGAIEERRARVGAARQIE